MTCLQAFSAASLKGHCQRRLKNIFNWSLALAESVSRAKARVLICLVAALRVHPLPWPAAPSFAWWSFLYLNVNTGEHNFYTGEA